MTATTEIRASAGSQVSTARPVVVAVDGSSAAAAAIRDGVRLARELEAPVHFVYVRRGPSDALGEPYYQRRLETEMQTGDRAIAAGIAAARRAGVPASGQQLQGAPAREVEDIARLRAAQLIVVGARRRRLARSVSRALIRLADRPVVVARRWVPNRRRIHAGTHGPGARLEPPWERTYTQEGVDMPDGVSSIPKSRASDRSGVSRLATRIRTRIGRAAADESLASGADPSSNPELALRAEQLSSREERARIANALVEALGDARRGEPMTFRSRPQRAVVRDAADDILALAERVRDGGPVGIAGVAAAARLVDDPRSPLYRHRTGDLHESIRSAHTALDATPEPAGELAEAA
jgi:nucleotide-binding universal stress UspA family protein